MDERKLRLKQLKKASKKAKRKYVTLWKTLGVLFLVCAIILSVSTGVVKLFDNAGADMVGDSFLGSFVSAMQEAYHHAMHALTNSFAMYGIGLDATGMPLFATLLAAAVVLWVLYTIMLVLWIRGKKKWKKSEAYLDYKTLKSTMKQEKQK